MKQMQQRERTIAKEHYGEEYAAAGEATAKNDEKKIQDAHEAIRPTDITMTPAMDERVSSKRSVPSVSADLETVCSQPDGCRLYMRRLLYKIRCRGISCLQHLHPDWLLMDFVSVYTDADDEKEENSVIVERIESWNGADTRRV